MFLSASKKCPAIYFPFVTWIFRKASEVKGLDARGYERPRGPVTSSAVSRQMAKSKPIGLSTPLSTWCNVELIISDSCCKKGSVLPGSFTRAEQLSRHRVVAMPTRVVGLMSAEVGISTGPPACRASRLVWRRRLPQRDGGDPANTTVRPSSGNGCPGLCPGCSRTTPRSACDRLGIPGLPGSSPLFQNRYKRLDQETGKVSGHDGSAA
ncbi:hypothetical protein GGR56DRAFT_423602 [Xylariaceae sp. FL0804]|nr:hypothetical protein GGR56DRAFT_423602 [Xylariaceae sp. FL0804]